MNELYDNSIDGTVPKSALVVCTSGRCSFELEGEHYELAKCGAIILRKGQTISAVTYSEDFSVASFEAPAQLLSSVEANGERTYSNRKSELFERFKDLLNNYYSREHDALFYAKQLRITQKYLALICKDLSGLSVKEWIDKRLLRDASFLLGNTNKTIFQISETLHFESPELFGKFFKRMSNLSPRQFRISCFETTKQI